MTVSQLEEIKNYINESIESSKSSKGKQPKNKIEFSKIIISALTIFTIVFTGLSYTLSFLDKNPIENLSIELIKTIWAIDGTSFFGYMVQNSARAWSLNMSQSNSEGS